MAVHEIDGKEKDKYDWLTCCIFTAYQPITGCLKPEKVLDFNNLLEILVIC